MFIKGSIEYIDIRINIKIRMQVKIKFKIGKNG